MTKNNLFNRPYYAVPVDDARVDLLIMQDGITDGMQCFAYEMTDGRCLVSPRIYFGTLLVHEDDGKNIGATRAEGRAADGEAVRTIVLAHCGGASGQPVVRIDYAWTDERAFVLRAGVPGSRSMPYSAFAADEQETILSYIEAFMTQPHADVLMAREIVDVDDSMLFKGEDRFYEGFIGKDLLPLEVCGPKGCKSDPGSYSGGAA